MVNSIKNNQLVIFLVCWFLLQFFSAYFTELYNDEAYYWIYAQHLDWGFFDHPPMVGALIKLGGFFSDNEIGVRLPFIILSTATIYLLYVLVKQDITKFIFLIIGIFPFHLLGFMALPDMPFLFFATLFFVFYEKYLEKDNLLNASILGISIAGMFYSKYHAILIVVFTILSNFTLFKRKTFYLTTFITLLVFAPNIIWQIVNDYPSVKYHFIQRSAKEYEVAFTSEYVLGQLFFYGPFISLFLWFFSIKELGKKSENLFQKALKYNLVGVFLFFLIMSFKGRVEVNWTIPFLAPLIILAYQYVPLNRWVMGCSIFTFVLTFIVRLHLITPLVDLKEERGHEFRGHKEFAKLVKEKAQGLPIVANSYQHAGILSFYLKEPITSLNIDGRKNLLGMLDFADDLEGKKVAFVNGHLEGDSINIKGHQRQVTILEKMPLYRNVSIKWLNEQTLKEGDNQLQLTIKKLNLNKNITFKNQSFLVILVEQNGNVIAQNKINWTENDFSKEVFNTSIFIKKIDNQSKTKISFAIITENLGSWWRQEYELKK